jgi:tetratricopeptide (TPR) repeat protein
MRGFRIFLPVAVLFAGLLVVSSGDTNVPIQERITRLRTLGKAFYENPTTQKEAVEQFKKALELNPKSAVDRLNYGLALLRAANSKEGIAELEAVQRQDPSLPHTWFNLGIEFKRMGDSIQAIAQLEKMAQLVADEPITHYNLGVLYKAEGRQKEATAKFELAAKLDPNFAAPHFQLFNAYRAAGRMDDAKRELARFQELKKMHEASGTGNEDVEWSRYAEVYEAIPPRQPEPAPAALRFENVALAGAFDAASLKLAAADIDGDGLPDLIAASRNGVTVFKSGRTPTKQDDLAAMKDVVNIAPGDYDNDGCPDLVVLTGAGPKLFRNDAGVLRAAPAALPQRRFEAAVWVDYDHDYDLDLLLLGETCALLRNQAQAGFADRTAAIPFQSGRAISGLVTRMVPDSKSHDIAVTYAGRGAVLYRDRLAGVYEAVPLDAIPAGAVLLGAVDADNDSTLDLAWQDGIALNRWTRFEALPSAPRQIAAFADFESRGAMDAITAQGVARNEAPAKYAAAKAAPAAPHAAAADFDGDGRTDAVVSNAGGKLTLALNRTLTRHAWTRVRLNGIKNLKLAPGAEVEVKSGLLYQKQLYAGYPLLFGLGRGRAIDTIRITWPNGLIQNEMNQKPGVTLKFDEAQRLSGSCPVIWTWNGERFEYITDVLGVAPLGASSGDGRYFPVDHDEYISIRGESLRPRNGEYEIRITEELSEVSYIDQVELIAVDHPAGIEIFSNDKWKSPPFPEFRLFGARNRVYPLTAREDGKRDVTERLLRRDRRYADGFQRDLQGVAAMHALDLDFGAAARGNRAVLILNGWVDWADGSTFLAQSQATQTGLVTPKLQVKDAAGRWVTVIEDMGMPAGKPKTIAVDLTGKFLSASREVRIVTNLCVFWDEIFLSEDSAPPETRLTALAPKRSSLAFRGFSATLIHPRREQPEQFFYEKPAAASLWNPTPGLYTRYGDVTPLTAAPEDRMVIMGSGDELTLIYDAAALPAPPPGWRRDWLLKVDGWAKDRDANTAFSQSVEPLPFHRMSSYPYPPGEQYPSTPEHDAYRREYISRPALRLLQPLQAGAVTLRKGIGR